MALGRVQYIDISRKVKNFALRYFYLNAEKNTSLGTAGYVRTRQILTFFTILNSCSIKIVYNARQMSILLNYSNISIQAITF